MPLLSLGVWMVIGALIVVAFALLKFKEIRHRIGLFLMISLALFLIVSIGYVTATNKVDLTTFEGIIEITKLYFSWLGSLFKNIMSLTGYAVKQDWGVNFSNFTIGK